MVAITNQFQSLGVIFQDLWVIDVSSDPFFTSGAGVGNFSSPNMGVINDEPPFSLLVTATFLDPVSGLPGMVDQVQAVFSDVNVGTNLVKLTAFGFDGSVIDVVDVSTPAAQAQVVGFNHPGIHRLVLETDTDGSLFDDFTFSTPTVVPEPSSLGIVVVGGLALLRRRA